MIAKRTGWPRVRRNIGGYCLATQSRPAPAAVNSRPSRTPVASGPPPAANVTTIIATPSSSRAVERIRVEVRCRSRGARMAHMLGAAAEPCDRRPWRLPPRAVGARAVGVDDHAAGALGEHRLDRLAEHRAAGAGGERQHDRLRPHLARLVDDHA